WGSPSAGWRHAPRVRFLLQRTLRQCVVLCNPLLCYHWRMRGVALSSLNCSIARTLDVVGERWTLLVLRDAFNGVRRFEDFPASLPLARNVLTDRLQTLVEHGILQRRRYQERPPRYEYRLTEKGFELYPVLIALLQWGDRHLA